MKSQLLTSCLLFLATYSFGQEQITKPTRQHIDSAIVNLQTFKVPGQMEAGLALLEPYFDSIRLCCGDVSHLMAKALIIKADFSREMGQFEQAVKFYENCLTTLNAIDSSYSEMASSATLNLGLTHILYGDPQVADSVLCASLAIREVQFGKESVQYATCLILIGKANLYGGDFEKAIDSYQKALGILQVSIGENNFDILTCLNGLGACFVETGQPEKALHPFQESVRITALLYGENHLNYAGAMMGLGNTYRALEQLGNAEKCILQALTIFRANVPPERRSGRMMHHYLSLLQNLSSVYHDMGKIEKGYQLAAEADSICRVSATPYPMCSGIAENKAHMLKYMGRYSEAEVLYFETIQNNADEFGKEHYYYASSILSLAMLYIKAGEFEKAKPLIEESCRLKEKLFGRDNLHYLLAYSQLGVAYEYLGDPENAEPILKYCVDISSHSKLTAHKRQYTFLQLLASFYHQFQMDSLAELTYGALMEVLPANYISASQYTSEREFLALQNTYTRNIHQFQSFLLDHPEVHELWGVNHDLVMLTKAFLLDTRLKLQASQAAMDIGTRESYQHWKRAQRELYTYSEEAAPDPEILATMESRIDSMEIRLFEMVPSLSDYYSNVHWQDVMKKLAPHEAAIEIIRIPYYTPEPTLQVRYAASILRAGDALPVFIPLGNEADLLPLLQTEAGTKEATINKLYSYSYNGQMLYNQTWAPMQPFLKNIQKIYLAPDGLFHRINIDAIPLDEKKCISDEYTIIQVADTRSLPNTGYASTDTKEQQLTALVMGGIYYDSDPEISKENVPDATNTLRGEIIENPDVKNITWPYLKYSDREADSTYARLKRHNYSPILLKGNEGTEEALENAGRWDNPEGSPHLLHLSTHGYFYPETVDGITQDVQGSGLAYNMTNHPMIRTGLLFAGVNQPKNEILDANPQTDGILTAYEISQLNLAQTDLVVLSACETGLGDIRGSEGVFGLQRAFKIAGADKVITSLWQVPDFQTYELMDLFYKGYLEEKLHPREALKYARDKMRKKRYEPFYWAGFVLME